MPGVPLLPPQLPNQNPISPNKNRWRVILFLVSLVLLAFFIYEWRDLSYRLQVMSIKNVHPDFVGRKDCLNALKNLFFSQTEGVAVGVLWGEGGVGKSETAIAFANKYQRHFSLIYWIESSSEDKYRQSYAHLAELLSIAFDPKDPIEVLRQRVHDFLQSAPWKKRWLLICDNVEESLELPERGNGAVLVTARSKGPWEARHCLQLVPFQENEALELVQKISKNTHTDEWKTLFEKLDYSPLAINVAAHYILTTPNLSVATYLDLLEKDQVTLLKHMPKDARYPQNILASWKLSTDALKKSHPEAYHWLHFCAYLYPDAIPQGWIAPWLEKEGYKEDLARLKSYEIVRVLTQLGLIRYDEKTRTFSLHRLKQQWLKKTAENSAAVSHQVLSFLAPLLHSVHYHDEIEWTQEVWADLAQWAPHAEWALSAIDSASISSDLATVLNILGNYHMVILSNYKKGLAFYERALEVHKCLEGPGNHVDLALVLCNTGETLGYLSQHEKARAYLEKSLQICAQVCGDYPTALLAQIYTHLGAASYSAAQSKKSREYLEKSLVLHEKIYGATPHPSTSEALKWLGACCKRFGDRKNALKFEERALEINQQFYNHQPNVKLAYIYGLIGEICFEMGDFKRALNMHEHALTLSFALHPTGVHIQILYTLLQLGSDYDAMGKHKMAIEYFDKTAELHQKLFKDDITHYCIWIERWKGFAWEHLGKNEKAIACYQASLTACQKVYGNQECLEAAYTQGLLGRFLCTLHRQPEGISLLEEAKGLFERLYEGIATPYCFETIKFMAGVYQRSDPQKAAAYLEEAERLESQWKKAQEE